MPERHDYQEVIKKQLMRLMSKVTEDEIDKYYQYHNSREITAEAAQWYKKLIRVNRTKKIYAVEKFETFIIRNIERIFYKTHDINWKNPFDYKILFDFFPASYVFKQVKWKILKRIQCEKK